MKRVTIHQRVLFYLGPAGRRLVISVADMREALELVGEDVPAHQIEAWSSMERVIVMDWAVRTHLQKSRGGMHANRLKRPCLLDARTIWP